MRAARHRLAARRNMLGLTQEALAEKLEVAVSTVARWEQGATAPRAWQRAPLAEVLGVTLGQLDELLLDLPEVSPAADGPTGSTVLEVEPPPSPFEPRPTEVPRVEGFVGRAREVAEIAEALRDRRVVAAVGRRGVGTSACAWEAVHLGWGAGATRPGFYLDLRPHGQPSSLRHALTELAREFGQGAPPTGGEVELRDWWERLRDGLAARHALVVLDNVDSVDDGDTLRMLVPLPALCRLLLIGTPELARLGNVHPIAVHEPGPDEAAELFAAASQAEPDVVALRSDPAVQELVDLCGRQPRAVTALARGIARGPLNVEGSLETLRLAVGAPPHQEVRFSLAPAAIAPEDVAYAALRPQSRQLFRRLGLVPQWLGRDAVLETADGRPRTFREGELRPEPLALEAMAELAGRSIKRVADLVGELSRGQFIQPVESVASAEVEEGGRYEIRPLLAAFARIHARHEEPTWRRVRSQVRLIRYLARQAERHAARPSLASREWFDCHHRLLAAVVAMATSRAGDVVVPLPRPVRRWWFRLAVALCLWYADEGRLDEWWAACSTVSGASTGRRLPVVGRFCNELGTLRGRPRVKGWVGNERGVILRRRGDARGAVTQLSNALPRRGRRGEAQVLTNRGLAFLDLDAVDAATADFKRAAQRRSPRDKVGQGLTELGLGVAYLRSGAAADARRHLVKAADAFDRAKDLRGSATARTNLVLAEWETGAHNAAIEAGEVAIEKFAELERLTGRKEPGGPAAAFLNTRAASEAARRRGAADH